VTQRCGGPVALLTRVTSDITRSQDRQITKFEEH
jgi:hypothetical protein